jgi:hypothetical protein
MMVTTRTAGRGRFQLQRASQLRSSLLCLPAELRHIIYSEVYQPRIYHLFEPLRAFAVDHPECKTPVLSPCSLLRCSQRERWAGRIKEYRAEGRGVYHHSCGCSLRGTVRFLRVCQQIYVEAQPYMLLNSTLTVETCDRRFMRIGASGRYVAPTLKAFHQNYIRSSLSGLKPITHLRRFRLALSQWERETFTTFSFISVHKWEFDLLEIDWSLGDLFDYSVSWILDSGCFKGISCLRDVKRMKFHWKRRILVFLMFEHQREPLVEGKADFTGRDKYEEVVTRAFNELVSRPREAKLRTRASMHEEAKAIFLPRLRHLMAEAGLSFRNLGDD